MGWRARFIALVFCLASSCPAMAESWDCKISQMSGDVVQPYDVEGGTLLGRGTIDFPEPRRRYQIITNTDKDLIAFRDSAAIVGIEIVTISKSDGMIQYRLLSATNDYEERYAGHCQPAQR